MIALILFAVNVLSNMFFAFILLGIPFYIYFKTKETIRFYLYKKGLRVYTIEELVLRKLPVVYREEYNNEPKKTEKRDDDIEITIVEEEKEENSEDRLAKIRKRIGIK